MGVNVRFQTDTTTAKAKEKLLPRAVWDGSCSVHSHHPAPDQLGQAPLAAQQCPAEQYQRAAMILSTVLTKIMIASIVIKRQ